MDLSRGRVTIALSVHGTTVIHQGEEVNDISSSFYESSHQKVYIYKDYKTYEDEISFTSSPWCITVVPCTDKAKWMLYFH
jgi:hypothetical protein